MDRLLDARTHVLGLLRELLGALCLDLGRRRRRDAELGGRRRSTRFRRGEHRRLEGDDEDGAGEAKSGRHTHEDGLRGEVNTGEPREPGLTAR